MWLRDSQNHAQIPTQLKTEAMITELSLQTATVGVFFCSVVWLIRLIQRDVSIVIIITVLTTDSGHGK